MRAITRAAVASFLALFVVVPAAGADTLPGRDAPFTPSQAVADQYLTPPVTPPSSPPSGGGQAGISITTPSGSRGGVGGDQAERAPAAVAPAAVEQGATAPRSPSGSLPFTGSDLLTLVWIALALLAAGTVVELARRRIESARAGS